jgi:putative addiction module component (TIGR02574 family)
MSTEQIIDEVLRLSAEQKARVADALLQNLSQTNPQIDAAWAEEVERRIDDYEGGRSKTIPAEQVMKKLRGRRK